MKKRFAVWTLCAVCFVALYALVTHTHVSAAEGEGNFRIEGDVLYIEGEGRMPDLAEDASPAYEALSKGVSEVRVGEGITHIGARAFEGMTNIKSVKLPSTLLEIGAEAFSGCISLEKIAFPASLQAIGDGAFRSCGALTEVVLPEGMQSLGAHAFASCTSLARVSLPSTVKKIGAYAFFGNTTLSSIQLPIALTEISEGCFRGCVSLRSVSFPTYLQTIGDNAFFGCTALREVSLGTGLCSVGDYAFAESGLLRMVLPEGTAELGDYAFSGCRSLVSINLPESLTAIPAGLCFSCDKLREVSLPTQTVSIGRDAFSYCLALEEITIPERVRTIGAHAFAYCTALECVYYLAADCLVAGSTAEPIFRGCVLLSEIALGARVSFLPDAFCYGLASLKSIHFGTALREIGKSAFEGCSTLESVNLPNGLITVGESAFYRCASLTAIKLPQTLQTAGKYAFYSTDGARIFSMHETQPHGFHTLFVGSASLYPAGSFAECRFFVKDQEVLSVCVPLGESCTEPSVPSYETKKGYTAYFSGWDLTGDGTADTLPLGVYTSFTAHALFRELPNRYVCRFYTDTGELYLELAAYYDELVPLPETPPSKASDAFYAYDFLSWSGYRDGMKVEGDMNFYANFSSRLLDLVPPVISGVSDGERYYATRTVTVTDAAGLASVTFDGGTLPLVGGAVEITLLADGKSHVIRALDMVGHETVVVVEGVEVRETLRNTLSPSDAVIGKESEIYAALTALDTLIKGLEGEASDTSALQGEARSIYKEILEAYRRSAALNAVRITSACEFLLDTPADYASLFTEADALTVISGGEVFYLVNVSRAAKDERADALAEEIGGKTRYKAEGAYRVSITRSVKEADGSEARTEVQSGHQLTLPLSAKSLAKKGAMIMTASGTRMQETDGVFTLSFAGGEEGLFIVCLEEKNDVSFLLLVALSAGLGTALLIGIVAYYLLRMRGRAPKTLPQIARSMQEGADALTERAADGTEDTATVSLDERFDTTLHSEDEWEDELDEEETDEEV